MGNWFKSGSPWALGMNDMVLVAKFDLLLGSQCHG